MSEDHRPFRVAAVQATPVCFDRPATLEIAAHHIARAGQDDADLVVFPESFVPGYPDWLWRTAPWSDPGWYQRFEANAVDVHSDDLDVVRSAAEAARTWVALGITERGPSGSLYNSVVYLDERGENAGVHRKLVPTGAERLVWANGQGPMLTVVDIGGVRVGALICWENYMPLARTAMYQQGIDILLSPTWDNSDEWISTLRHTAKEGQLFVVGITAFLRGSDIPRDLPEQTTSTATSTTSCPGATPRSSHPAENSSPDPSSEKPGRSPRTSTSGSSPPAVASSTPSVTTRDPTSSHSPPTTKEQAMSDFPSIGHVAVTVKDLTVSRPWYQALIGAEPVLDEPTDGGFHHTVFSIGGTLIGLHQHPHNEVADRFTELRTGHDQDRPLPLKPQPRRRVLKPGSTGQVAV